MKEPSMSMLENFLNNATPTVEPVALIKDTGDVKTLIATNIAGLLSQQTLTSEQLHLLDLLLRRWEP